MCAWVLHPLVLTSKEDAAVAVPITSPLAWRGAALPLRGDFRACSPYGVGCASAVEVADVATMPEPGQRGAAARGPHVRWPTLRDPLCHGLKGRGG